MRPIRVLTLNVWNRSGPWEARLEAIRRGIRALDPDLVALQEVLHAESMPEIPGQHLAIAEGLGYHTAYAPSWELAGVGFGNAILSRWPIRAQQELALPAPVGPPSQGAWTLLFAEIEAPFGVVPFFATHLAWRLHEGALRREQVLSIATHVARLSPVGRHAFPAILAGDFNAEPDADEIRFLKGLATLDGRSIYFADSFGVAGTGPGVTFSKRNTFAALEREPERRIDYVFVRGPDELGRGQPLLAQVCLDAPVDGVFPSDHFGVLATIRVDEDA